MVSCGAAVMLPSVFPRNLSTPSSGAAPRWNSTFSRVSRKNVFYKENASLLRNDEPSSMPTCVLSFLKNRAKFWKPCNEPSCWICSASPPRLVSAAHTLKFRQTCS